MQECYEEDVSVFDDIQAVLAKEWAEIQRIGIDVDGVRVYPIILGIKADWSYQVPHTEKSIQHIFFWGIHVCFC